MSRPMKDSGVEWIGDIPTDWNVANIRKLFSFGKGLPITKENLRESGLSVISYGQIHSKFNDGTTVKPELIRFVDDYYLQSNPESIVKKNDFIFADTSEDLTGCGNCVYIDTDDLIFAGYHTIILRNKTDSELKYFAFLFQSDAWRKQIRERVTGVKLFSISQKILRATSILIPPLDEQQRIATFLDGECARIDSVIEKTRASIEEYKKLKQAVITRAVTKGIRPARTFKDSGIDWLGEIPTDWNVGRIKNLANIFTGNSIRDEEKKFYEDPIEAIPYISTKDIDMTLQTINFSNGMYIKSADESFKHAPAHSVLLCIEGGSAGKKIAYTAQEVCFVNKLCCFHSNSCSNKYIYYYLMSPAFTELFNSYISGLIGGVSVKALNNFKILLPPLDEQKEIAVYLDEKTAAIDLLIAKKNQLATELASLKKSLIFEYVTGKKAVPI